MTRILILLIQFYQKTISPALPPSCRFYPTCSQYSVEAFSRFGVFKGFVLTIKRLSKCHPFHSGGIDLVPEKTQKQERR